MADITEEHPDNSLIDSYTITEKNYTTLLLIWGIKEIADMIMKAV